MSPLYEFSWAMPWIIVGFVLGALLVALSRWLSGGGKKVEATIQSLHDELSNARLEVSRLNSDNGFLNTAIADAERRAAEGGNLAAENARLAKSEAESRNRAAGLAHELERVRADLQTYNTRGTSLEAEVQRLRAENASLKQSWDSNAQNFNAMRSDLAAAEAKLRDFDLIRLKLEDAQKQLGNGSVMQAELERLRSDNEALRKMAEHSAKTSTGDANALVAAEQEIMRLKGALNEAGALAREADGLKSLVQRLTADNTALRAAVDQQASQPNYSDELAAAQREIARLKTSTAYSSAQNAQPQQPGSAELDRVKADLAAANAALTQAKVDLEKASRAQPAASSGTVSQAEYNGVMTDLTATRNLSIVQAKELQHLRAEVARLAAASAGDEAQGSGMSYADAPMSGRYTDRPLVSTRSSGLRSRFRGWRNPAGVEGEIAMLRAKVEQQEEEIRRLVRRSDD